METPSYTLWQLVAYFLGLGTHGFGGPVALVGYMHRDLVERRGWITEAEYREGLALAQLAPGPLAAQLAIYLGYVHYQIIGATLVGLAFVLPSFLMVLALGWAYVIYGGLSWMRAVFYGVGPAVIGIIAYSAYKLTRKTIGKDRLLWLLYSGQRDCHSHYGERISLVSVGQRIFDLDSQGTATLTWRGRIGPAARSVAANDSRGK